MKIEFFINAHRLLTALDAAGLPRPEVGEDPDGECSFEWSLGKRAVFSVSIAADGTLSYAGLVRDEAWSGTVRFENEVPPVIGGGILNVWVAARV